MQSYISMIIQDSDNPTYVYLIDAEKLDPQIRAI